MSLNVGGSGKLFGHNTKFDLSGNTSLGLDVIDPDGVRTAINTSRLSAPSVDKTFDELVGGVEKKVTYLANEYIQFLTLVTDFTIGGTWQSQATYNNTGTDPDEIFPSDKVNFVVEDC